MRRLITLLCALGILLCMAVNASAAGSVTYDGDADRFIFAPGIENSPTNLFEQFRNVMPGDSLTEQVLIKNDTSNGVKIKVYLRSLGAQENTGDFLSQMQLTVKQEGDSILFGAPANETAQLTDWVYLGTVYSGGEITLNVTLDVPITLDDSYQNSVGYIDWQFKVEELPVEPSDPQPPNTGDTAPLNAFAIVTVVSFTALGALLLFRRRKETNP